VGRREPVAARRVTLYGLDDAGAAYGPWAITLSLPSCPDCAPTFRFAPPREVTWSILAAAISLTIAVSVFVGLGQPPWMLVPVALLSVVGARAAVRRWIRRPLVGNRVTNYQPVRNLGKRVGLFEICALSFANRGYAAAVSEQVGHLGPGEAPPSDQLPAARVVKRPR